MINCSDCIYITCIIFYQPNYKKKIEGYISFKMIYITLLNVKVKIIINYIIIVQYKVSNDVRNLYCLLHIACGYDCN